MRREKESTYIERNIEATRQAYGITEENVDYVDYPGVGTKQPQDVPADRTTIANTRLLDPNDPRRRRSPRSVSSRTSTGSRRRSTSTATNRTASCATSSSQRVSCRRTDFHGNQTDWINRHTVYTHGNGFVAAQANEVTAVQGDSQNNTGGYPIYSVSDLTTTPENENLKVDQSAHLLRRGDREVGRRLLDRRFVDGEGPVSTTPTPRSYTYTGSGGVSIGNWFNRLAFAAKYTERNILFSSAIGYELEDHLQP